MIRQSPDLDLEPLAPLDEVQYEPPTAQRPRRSQRTAQQRRTALSIALLLIVAATAAITLSLVTRGGTRHAARAEPSPSPSVETGPVPTDPTTTLPADEDRAQACTSIENAWLADQPGGPESRPRFLAEAAQNAHVAAALDARYTKLVTLVDALIRADAPITEQYLRQHAAVCPEFVASS